METQVVLTVIVALVSLLVIATVASFTRFVPEGSVAITNRLGRPTGVREGRTFRAVPLIDSATIVAVSPFSRQVTLRSATRDGLDIGATIRVHLQPVDALLFGRKGQTFDDKHEALTREAIAAALIGRSHAETLAAADSFGADVHRQLAVRFVEFGVAITRIDVEGLRPSLTGAPVTRPTSEIAGRVIGPVELLELARRDRQARLHPPDPTDFDFSLAALLAREESFVGGFESGTAA